MSPHHKTAILLGAGTAMLSAALTGGVALWLPPASVSKWSALFAGAVLTGVFTAIVMVYLGRRLQRDIQRVAEYLCDLSVDNEVPPCRPGFGLDVVASAAAQSIGTHHQHIESLVRHRRERELQDRINQTEYNHLEAILNAISDGVVVTDAFNEVSLANDTAARALQFELDSSLRRPLDEVTEDARLVKLIKDTRDAGPAMRRTIEHRLGDHATYRITTTRVGSGDSLRNSSGAGVVTVLRDVTKDKEIAEMKSDFVSKVSHELRTPLSSIKAYIEMLIDGEAHDESTRAEFYNIVQGETQRLQRMIDNILSISQIESGVTKISREQVALPALLRECVEVLQPQADTKRIALTEEPYPPGCDIFADRDMMVQAVMNVVANAIKYTPDGGSVGLSMETDEHNRCVVVSVCDTGVGIPAEDVSQLFQKFFRVASNNKLAKGTGLGLSLVKHAVETVHGGRVSVESEVGKGSTFKLALPMADNINSPARAPR